VEYHLQLKTVYQDGEEFKTIKRTHGKEIVEESFYCKNHIPKDIEPKVVENVVRKQLVRTIFKRANKKQGEGE
jgi:hypothetical protein